jgi:hypothetical protein
MKPIAKTGLTKSNGMVALAVELAGSSAGKSPATLPRIVSFGICLTARFTFRPALPCPAFAGIPSKSAKHGFGVTASELKAIRRLHNRRFSRTFSTLARQTPCESQLGNLRKLLDPRQ